MLASGFLLICSHHCSPGRVEIWVSWVCWLTQLYLHRLYVCLFIASIVLLLPLCMFKVMWVSLCLKDQQLLMIQKLLRECTSVRRDRCEIRGMGVL